MATGFCKYFSTPDFPCIFSTAIYKWSRIRTNAMNTYTIFYNDGVAEMITAQTVTKAKALATHKKFNRGFTPDGRKIKIVQIIEK